MAGKAINLEGKVFNRWKVLKKENIKLSQAMWLCECECGTRRVVNSSSLRNGKSKSCGCWSVEWAKKGRNRVTHGHAKIGKTTNIYKLWLGIKKRCFNLKCKSYKYYGGRGISMYKEWITSFLSFKEYMEKNLGNRPYGYSLDRVNNDGNYEPGNLRWATQSMQNKNRKSRR